jgi:hypothetical protein
MSFCLTITTYNNKSVQQKAKMANERRPQSQAWLRRQEEQKKPGEPHRPVTPTPDSSHSAAAGSGTPQSFGRKR